MKRSIGFMVVFIALFLSASAFATDSLVIKVSNFGCSGPKFYEVASKDEVKKDGTPYFTWFEAFTACNNSTMDGETDWFLPESDALDAMYEQLYLEELGSFGDGRYWNSTDRTNFTAWCQIFNLDGKQEAIDKRIDGRVRCIRKH